LGSFLGSISTAFVRVFAGFRAEDPPEGHTSNFYGFEPYIYLVILLFAAVTSYILVNKGLRHFNSVFIAPLVKIGGMMHSLFTGGIVLNEFAEYTDNPSRFFFFLCGIAI
jgi:hypothetical protein